ncbi:hypothetical protein K457DRAFT_22605 [Linnemannia elongata AG-77]|uniref:Uncharacterized protein n=1 Tax=Linnemannia elongata AG-77 TaxID=1314771 RepID=A0A197JLA4_9FUNG|nr:hypothetical protein K457DRAFT_22605 [Linnemannia elongata AG-77]
MTQVLQFVLFGLFGEGPFLSRQGYRTSAIGAILMQYPKLTTSSFPTLSSPFTGQVVGAIIQEYCPGIRWALVWDARLYNGMCVHDMLESIPYPQLEILIEDSKYTELEPNRMDDILQNHIPTCNLVKFSVVCRKLQFLRLAIQQAVESHRSDDMVAVMQERETHFRGLARQIGTLHRPKPFILASVTVDAYRNTTLDEFGMPGLFIVQDPVTGRKGHLSYLSSI